MNFINRLTCMFVYVLFSFTLIPVIYATTIYVNNNGGLDSRTGRNGNVSDNVKGPVATITKAVQLASSGDSISIAYTSLPYIEPGSSLGIAQLIKSVKLSVSGAGANRLIIDQVNVNPGSGLSVTFNGSFAIRTLLTFQSGTLACNGVFSVSNLTVNSQNSSTLTINSAATQHITITGSLNITKGVLNITAAQNVIVTGNAINFSSSTTVTGTGALSCSPESGTLIINLPGPTTISTLSINGNTSLAGLSGSLSVGSLTHSNGLLSFGDRDIIVTTTFNRTGNGTYSAGKGYLQINAVNFTQDSNFIIPNLKISSPITIGTDQDLTVTNNLYLDNATFTITPFSTPRLILGVIGGLVPTIIVSGNGNLDAAPTFAIGKANYSFTNAPVTIGTGSNYWPTNNTTTAQNITMAYADQSTQLTFADSRTINGNLGLNEGVIGINDNVTLTLATSGSTISRTEVSSINLDPDANGIYGNLTASNVNILYSNSDTNAPAAIGNAGPEFSSPNVITNLTNNNVNITLNTAKTIQGTIILNGNTTIAENITLAGNVTINSGVRMTINSSKILTALGNVNMNSSASLSGGGTMTFAGVNVQSFIVPSYPITITNLNVNMTGTNPRLTISGGNVTVTNLSLTNGLVIVSPNSNLILNTFTRNETNLSYIVGNVQRSVPFNSVGRFEFPVGTLAFFRPVAITFSSPILSNTIFTVSADSTNTGDSINVPLLINDVMVNAAANFDWRITATPTLAPSQVYDLEFTCAGYTNYISNGVPDVADIRVVTQLGSVLRNSWIGQTGTYSNSESAPGVPIVNRGYIR